MEKAASLSNQPYNPYPGTQVAPLSSQHLQGVSNIEQRALSGSPAVMGAQNMLDRTQSNDYLNYAMGLAGQDNPYQNARNPLLGMNNPYLNDAISRAQDDTLRKYQLAVQPQFAAAHRASGSFGNSGIQQMELESQRQLANELGGISNNMRMQDYGLQVQLGESDLARNSQLAESQMQRLLAAYQGERGAQMQAAQLAPGLAEQDYRDWQALLGGGDILREYQQQKLAEQYGNWQAEQQWPYAQLDVYGNAIRSLLGAGGSTTTSGSSTQPNPYQPSRTASAIGGGALGYSGAQAMGMSSPWLGGLIGAGAGYALG
jgi:hypothetical protein